MSKNSLPAWGLLLALAGCSDISVTTDYDRTADFSSMKTYGWLPVAMRPGDPVVDSLLDARVHESADAELKARGFAIATNGAPDFQITYSAAVNRKIEARPTTANTGYGLGRMSVITTEVTSYDEGTLVLDIVDPKSRTLLWRGVGRGAVAPRPTPDERDEKIRDAVNRILKEFPPKK